MSNKKTINIKNPKGKLGILIPGLGAVSSTFIAGVELIRKKITPPIGSLTQMGTARLGKRTDNNVKPISELVPLYSLDNIVFGAWDIFPDNGYEVAKNAGVLSNEHVESAKELLETIKPMPGVFDPKVVRRLNGTHICQAKTKREQANAIREDIKNFTKENNTESNVMIMLTSTEVHRELTEVHSSLSAFEKGLDNNDSAITPSQIYIYAALRENVPFANGTPNISVDTPAMIELSKEMKVPIAGKDLKSGQTMMKTAIAPAFKARMLGLNGWYSTNILGNRDGEVLDDPEAFKSKEITKKGVLDFILQPKLYPELYKDAYHKISIQYYPPRGDEKEGWDNIDIFGWMGYPMQIKINFLCRDSILAAPLVLDIALFLNLAHRIGWADLQEWLSFYFKSPIVPKELYPEHDLFIQLAKLKNTLRHLAGEDLITHLGVEYYDYGVSDE